MKRDTTEPVNKEDNDMRREYDFADGVRGKHCETLREGYTVKIHQADGTTIVQQVQLEAGAVVLEPDVRKYFPDSEAVNRALRCLIPLVATEQETEAEP